MTARPKHGRIGAEMRFFPKYEYFVRAGLFVELDFERVLRQGRRLVCIRNPAFAEGDLLVGEFGPGREDSVLTIQSETDVQINV